MKTAKKVANAPTQLPLYDEEAYRDEIFQADDKGSPDADRIASAYVAAYGLSRWAFGMPFKVMSMDEGLVLNKVNLINDDPDAGYPCHWLGRPEGFPKDLWAMRCAMASFSGPAAAIRTGIRRGTREVSRQWAYWEEETIQGIIDHYFGYNANDLTPFSGSPASAAMMAFAKTWATENVVRIWPAIEAVAAMLIEARNLDYEALDEFRVLGDRPDDQWVARW